MDPERSHPTSTLICAMVPPKDLSGRTPIEVLRSDGAPCIARLMKSAARIGALTRGTSRLEFFGRDPGRQSPRPGSLSFPQSRSTTLNQMDDMVECRAARTLDEAGLQRYVGAHHEAAHTVARLVVGAPFHEAILDADGLGISRGYTEGFARPWASRKIKALVSMAGPAIEAYFYSMRFGHPRTNVELFESWLDAQRIDEEEPDEPGPRSDVADAGWRAGEAYVFSEALLEIHWAAIKALATVLLAEGRVGYEDLDEVLPGFVPDPQRVRAAAEERGHSFVFEWIEYSSANRQ